MNTWYAIMAWTCFIMGSIGSVTSFLGWLAGSNPDKITPLLFSAIGAIFCVCHEVNYHHMNVVACGWRS